MTRPQLYPNHQHQWVQADFPDADDGPPHMARCTVCDFRAPWRLTRLDGELVPYDGIVAVGPPDPYPDDLQDSRIYDEMPIDDQEAP